MEGEASHPFKPSRGPGGSQTQPERVRYRLGCLREANLLYYVLVVMYGHSVSTARRRKPSKTVK